jgi:deoxyribonuclease V
MSFAWTTDPAVAFQEQWSLRELVNVDSNALDLCSLYNGVAIATAYNENTKSAYAIGVPVNSEGKYGRKTYKITATVDFQYTSGLLAFRVAPAICELLDQITVKVDFILFDAQGIAHPRGFGLASHIGVLYHKPTLGITRNSLFGSFVEPPSGEVCVTPIKHPDSRIVIGSVLNFRDTDGLGFVSPGHLFTPNGARDLILKMTDNGEYYPRSVAKAHAIANKQVKCADTARTYKSK